MNNLKLLVISLSIFWMAQQHAHAGERIDAIAAIVNGEVITCFEVDNAKQSLKTQLQEAGAELPTDDVLAERALSSRIQRALQYQEAQKLEMKISEDEVNAAILDVEKRNNLEPGQLVNVLKAQGIDADDYRETVKDRILNSRLINVAVRASLSVSEEAIKEYYRKNLKDPQPVREVRSSQLFVAIPADANSAVVELKRAEAEAYYQRLKNGEDFNTMVTIESDAPNASEGGDMGWVSQGMVKGAFAQIFDTSVGDITSVIRSAGGFHIVKVMDERMRKPTNLLPYDEVHARHILLQIPDSADLNAQLKIRQRASAISQELQGTSDEAFAVRAKELSQGPSAARGGDLGWFKPGQMVPQFDEVVFAMKPGETSGVVETQFGLHVVRLVEKRSVNPNAFEAHQKEIEQLLMDAELQQQVPRWMNGLIEQAKIDKRSCALVTGISEPLAAVEAEKSIVGTKDAGTIADVSKPSQEAAVENDSMPSFVLNQWKTAWQNKDLDAYFANYAQSQSPDKRFADFAQWEKYKTRVFAKHSNIHVEISNVIEEILEEGVHMQFSFDQHFHSDSLDDFDRKVVEMVNIDGLWKIVSERTVK